MARGPIVAVCSLALLLLPLALSGPSMAKQPQEWRIVFLDTGETVRITDPMRAWDFFNATHYQMTGDTPVTDDPDRVPTAEVYGDPCNAPADCESLWYRFYGSGSGGVAYMNYYLQDGRLYHSWTRAGLEAQLDSFRTVRPYANTPGDGMGGTGAVGG